MITLCALAEAYSMGRQLNEEVQQQPTGNTTGNTQQQTQLQQLANMPQAQKVAVAKQEAQELMNGQENPNDPVIQNFLRMILGVNRFYPIFCSNCFCCSCSFIVFNFVCIQAWLLPSQ